MFHIFKKSREYIFDIILDDSIIYPSDMNNIINTLFDHGFDSDVAGYSNGVPFISVCRKAKTLEHAIILTVDKIEKLTGIKVKRVILDRCDVEFLKRKNNGKFL